MLDMLGERIRGDMVSASRLSKLLMGVALEATGPANASNGAVVVGLLLLASLEISAVLVPIACNLSVRGWVVTLLPSASLGGSVSVSGLWPLLAGLSGTAKLLGDAMRARGGVHALREPLGLELPLRLPMSRRNESASANMLG